MPSPIYFHQQAAAKAARFQQFLSEDLNHGQGYDGVVLLNPFR